MDGVAVTCALFGSLRGLIHPAVGFPAFIKRCYVTPLEQVRTCVCARCDLRVELILALVHCSVSQSVCAATMEWTEENTLGFIELYETIFVLCDPNHPKYYNKLHKHLPTRSSEQLVDHSAQPVRRNALRIVRTYTSGRAEPRAVTASRLEHSATDPCSEHVILIVFPWKHWLHEGATM